MTTLDAVLASFQFLISEYGYAVTRKDYDTQYFGNCIVELLSETNAIKITVDRGQAFVEIGDARAQDTYYDLWIIMTHLSGHRWSYDFSKPLALQLDDLEKLVRLQYEAIFDNDIVHTCHDDLDNIVKDDRGRWSLHNPG